MKVQKKPNHTALIFTPETDTEMDIFREVIGRGLFSYECRFEENDVPPYGWSLVVVINHTK